MLLEQSFEIGTDPDCAYELLLDVPRVAACVPGATLSEVVDADTYRGSVRVKVGPITATYGGTARIVARDAERRSARIEVEATEGGTGALHASATLSVDDIDAGSRVSVITEVAIAGRLAQFGRGIIEAVAKRIVADMAVCLQAQLGGDGATPAPADERRSVSAFGMLGAIVADKVRPHDH